MISEGQQNDITYAIPLLEQINLAGSRVLADRGYDSNRLIDYIYDHGGEPTIPSRKGAKFERHCDWWLYKDASPYDEFEIIADFEEYLQNYMKERDDKK